MSNYNSMGEIAIDDKLKNKEFSKGLKLQAINDYINGIGSLTDIKSTLIDWILKISH